MLASGDKKGQILLWDISSLKTTQKFDGECKIQDLKFSNDNKLLAAS